MTERLHHPPDCYSRAELCRTFGLSRSGLYDHALKVQGSRCLQDKVLAKQIKSIFDQRRRTYGARRLQRMLRRQGTYCGRTRLGRLMRQLGLVPLQKRRRRPRTTQSETPSVTQSAHREPIAPNRLNQLPLLPTAPNQVWCADLTYLPSQQDGWLYLAAELDLCSKRLLGWKLSTSLASSVVQEAFERARKLWNLTPQIHRSDRGVQYASSSFRQLLDSCQVRASMSRKACCYDNAAMESFWATLKTDACTTRSH
jgi:putative transposase